MPATIANPTDTLKTQAMQQVLATIPLMALVGGGARGAVGLMNFLQRSTRPTIQPQKRRSVLTLPVPMKMASEAGGWGKGFQNLARSLTDAFRITHPGGTPAGRGAWTSFMAGDNATHAGDLPWKLPATFGLGVASGLGGYKIVDSVLDQTRKMETDAELKAAKERYEAALRGTYQKHASTEAPSPDPLEATYTWMEKQGGLGGMAGLYLTAMLTAGMGTGMATYDYTRARSRDKILAEAAKRRRTQIFQQTQMPMFAKIQQVPALADSHAPNA